MASLHILKGVNQGQRVKLEGDKFILGRNPDCHFVIPITSVSREHAHIVRSQGHFYIEDMQSRNGTKVNNQTISGRTLLKDNDKIQICDFIASFHEAAERPPLPPELALRPANTSMYDSIILTIRRDEKGRIISAEESRKSD